VRALSRDEAIVRIRSPLRELRWGKLRALIDVRIPYDVFELEGNQRLAIDCITGTLDLYRLDDIANGEESRIVERKLSQEQTRSSLQKRLARHDQVIGDHAAVVLVPYWVGIFERKGTVHIEVLDGIRGTLEGAKMRDVIEEYLAGKREDCEEDTR